MSAPHPDEVRLNDYVDGLLEPAAVPDVERHLQACVSCRAWVDSTRRLLEAAAGLPPAVEPPATLWEGVAGRTVDRVPARSSARTLRSARWQLAAAATVLVALSSVVTAVIVGREDRSSASPAAPTSVAAAAGSPGVAATAPARFVASQYQPTVARLRAELEARRAELSPATVQAVEANLEVIDRAIATTSAALAADPSSQPATQLLTSMYRKKIGLLEQTLQLGT